MESALASAGAEAAAGATRAPKFVAVTGEVSVGDAGSGTAGSNTGPAFDSQLDLAAAAAVGENARLLIWFAAVGLLADTIVVSNFGFGTPAMLAVASAVGICFILRLLAGPLEAHGGSQRMTAALVVCLAALGLPCWLEEGVAGEHRWMSAGLVLGLGVTAASGLAARLRLAMASVVPVLSLLASALIRSPWSGPLVGACFCGVVAVPGLALWHHRRWERSARATILAQRRVDELVAERDAATRADREKSHFLAVASHDLRQPVHALGLFAATLEKRLQGSAEEPLARNMILAIDGLGRSFEAMLDVSRLDAGTIEPNIQHFPLRDVFRRLHMHFAGQAEQKGLGLRFSPGGKSVNSDPQLLERMLGNLVQNAIKYTEEGGIVVVARSTRTHLNIEVWDTGIGVTPADLPRIFDEFYQVGRGERARPQGLGMGLAIVKRLAQLLGHRLTVSSRPDCGTMFRVGVALGGLHEIQDVTAAADTLPMPVSQARCVLVIDDEEAIREGLFLLLQEWGYEPIAAASIRAAERAIVSLDVLPDLILSDLHLGDGPDGIEAVAAIRRLCGHEVSAILITGDTTHEEMRRITESGVPVLFKPVQPRKLYNVLRGLLP